MKKYVPKCLKLVRNASITSFLIFVVGFVLFLFGGLNIEIPLLLTFFGGGFGILFVAVYFAAKSRVFIIGEEKIVIPRGANINDNLSFSKTSLKKSDICYVERTFFKGDKIISEDTYFYTVKLKGGTKVTFPLYEYGKKAEEEIFCFLKDCVS